MTDTTTQDRKAFEEVLRAESESQPLKFSTGKYMQPEHRIAWKFWSAACAHRDNVNQSTKQEAK